MGHSYHQRAAMAKTAIGAKLLHLLERKKSNLAFSADVIKANELLALADLLGPHICVLKTHIDIIEDFTPELTVRLKQLALKHDFLIFEDRKFADIGHTVQHQYQGGLYKICEWADFINAHVLPGPGIIQGLAEIGVPRERGLILLAEMSSRGHLMDERYQQATYQMAKDYSHFVIGFITQRALVDPALIHFTPGVQLQAANDKLGQQYRTPEQAIYNDNSDIVIVGRGILKANDPLAEAMHYRAVSWEAYLRRLSLS